MVAAVGRRERDAHHTRRRGRRNPAKVPATNAAMMLAEGVQWRRWFEKRG